MRLVILNQFPAQMINRRILFEIILIFVIRIIKNTIQGLHLFVLIFQEVLTIIQALVEVRINRIDSIGKIVAKDPSPHFILLNVLSRYTM